MGKETNSNSMESGTSETLISSKSLNKETADIYGPALPSDIQKKKEEKSDVYGPVLPDKLLKGSSNAFSENEERYSVEQKSNSNSDYEYGPVLPPNFKDKQQTIKGPQLPPGFSHKSSDSESDDEGVIGPMPSNDGGDLSAYALAADLERRAKMMQEKLEAKNSPKALKRESWMIELPEERAKEFGFGARSFRKNAAPERDRSWSEIPGGSDKTPSDGKSKVNLDSDLASRRRDERMETVASELSAKRKESLLEMHQKGRKKKKTEENEADVRRPFDRETDLQVNRFDEAQRQAAVKRSRGAADKFASGSQKFL